MLQIRRLTELDHLAGCSSLKQLFLADNPAVSYYKDFTALAGWVSTADCGVCSTAQPAYNWLHGVLFLGVRGKG